MRRVVVGSVLVCLLVLVWRYDAQPALAEAAAKGPVTFSRDVAPIVYANCTVCHRPGAIGPFALVTYEDAHRHARQIADVTSQRQMPPWKPHQGFGEFKDQRVLSDAQINTLAAWAAGGAPQGDPGQTPRVPKFRDGWQLGKPDMVLKVDKPFVVPAEGADVYVQFVFPLKIDGAKIYVRAVECRPSNLRIAHHAIGFLDTSGKARELAAKDGGTFYRRTGDVGFLPAGMTAGYVPGQTPRMAEEGSAIVIKKGTDFVLQMHYHPTGKEEADQTEIGFYLTSTPPTKKGSGLLMGSQDIDIPANEGRFQVKDEFRLPAPLKLEGIWAHMHMLGKDVRVWATLPDGTETKLLWIDDWDFNWQDAYQYRTPIHLPRGAVIHAQWTFDNTASNVRNPNQPPRRVRLGENSTDEMAGVILGGEAASDGDNLAMLIANAGHYLEVTSRGKKFKQAHDAMQ
jgi:mono/diheme cytochrome c family protein